MPNKTHVFLGVFICILIPAAMCINGCDIGLGTQKVKKPPGTGTSTTTGTDAGTDGTSQTSGDSDNPWEPEIVKEEEDKPPMDTSKLKWYFKDAKVGDWVKYWTPYNIEVWEIIKISGQKATVEKRFYDKDGKEKKKRSKPINMLGLNESLEEAYEQSKDLGKLETAEGEIHGEKVKFDIICNRDRNAQVGSLDMWSTSVPLEGRALAMRNEKVAQWVLDSGHAGDAKMKVKAGEIAQGKTTYQEPADALVAGWSNLVMQVNIDLRQYDGPSRTDKKKAAITIAPFKMVPITPEAKKVSDSQKNGTKGIRPGMWRKVLVQQDHLQVWEVTEVTGNGYNFRRIFYNNKALLYDIQCASNTFELAQLEETQKDDGSYFELKDPKDKVFTLADTGKKYECTKYLRRGAGSENFNWFTKAVQISTGRVFSRMRGTVITFVVDFGDETNAERKKIKPGDVKKAKNDLYKAYPPSISDVHLDQIKRWKDERQNYLDALNGVCKRAGRKLWKCNKTHYICPIDGPNTGKPDGWVGLKLKGKKIKKKNKKEKKKEKNTPEK